MKSKCSLTHEKGSELGREKIQRDTQEARYSRLGVRLVRVDSKPRRDASITVSALAAVHTQCISQKFRLVNTETCLLNVTIVHRSAQRCLPPRNPLLSNGSQVLSLPSFTHICTFPCLRAEVLRPQQYLLHDQRPSSSSYMDLLNISLDILTCTHTSLNTALLRLPTIKEGLAGQRWIQNSRVRPVVMGRRPGRTSS